MTKEQCRAAVVAALAAGAMPRDRTMKMWAGNGTGNQCVICGSRLTPSDVEFEIESRPGEGRRVTITRWK